MDFQEEEVSEAPPQTEFSTESNEGTPADEASESES